MANLPISGLTASASNLASTDVAPVVQTTGVGPVKMTGLQLAGGLLGSATFNGSTVTTSQPVLNLSQTWNAGAVTFTGLKFNATDTASASGSLLLDLQVGGVSQFKVDKVGSATILTSLVTGGILGQGGSTAGYSLSYYGNGIWLGSACPISWSSGVPSAMQDTFLRRAAAATLQLGAADAAAPVAQTFKVQSVVAGTTNTAGANFTIQGSQGTGTGAGGSIIFQVSPAGSSGTAQNAYQTILTIAANGVTTFGGPTIAVSAPSFNASTSFQLVSNSATINFGASADLILARDAANTLALRNGTNAQTFNVYNTYTDAANYERLQITWFSNVAYINTTAAGSGGGRALVIRTDSAQNLTFGTNAIARWQVDGTNGHFLAGTDNTYDIGASGANRPRVIYVSNSINSPSYQLGTHNWVDLSGTIWRIGIGGGLTNGQIFSAGGTLSLDLNGTFIGIGGTTSSHPALKRSGSTSTLIVRNGDDTANAPLESASVKTDAPAGGTSGTWKLGVRVAATTTLDTTQYIEVDVGGTLYKLAVVTV